MTNKKIKILVAEDDKFITRAMEDGLGRAGFEIVSASDGKDAIEKITNSSPDIILLDLVMPVMDGFEVLEKINQDEKLRTKPILVFSNLENADDIQRAKDLGANEYLLKAEYTIADIVKKIKEYCKI